MTPILRCEKCDKIKRAPLLHHEGFDEYWCDNCHTTDAEAQWERYCAAFHDGGDTSFTSLLQQQEAARKLK